MSSPPVGAKPKSARTGPAFSRSPAAQDTCSRALILIIGCSCEELVGVVGILPQPGGAPMPEGTIKQQTVIPPAGHFSCVVEPGERIRLVEVEDQQVADFMSFDRADPREQLSMFTSRAIGLTWKLTAPHTLYSNLSRPMWLIEEDTVRDNYCGGGYCNSRLNGA